MKKILIVLGVFFLINVIKFNIYAKEDNISSEISDTVAEGNEYAFMAETEEEAQAIAKYYNATLLSFEYGVGSIYIDKNNQAQTGGHGGYLDPRRDNSLRKGLILCFINEALINVAHAFKEVFSAHT